MSNQRNRWLPGALLGIALGATGCTGKLTPQQAAPLLEASVQKNWPGSHFECQDGERGWEYICQVRHLESTGRPGERIEIVERMGALKLGYYQGTPQFTVVSLRGQGPVPSVEEFSAQRKALLAEHAKKAAEEVRKNMAERRRSVPQSEESAR